MAEKLKLGESTAEMIRKINDVITEVNSDEDYSLPLAANGTRGGLQVGYTESGANIPVKLSSEKAYVTVSKTSVTSALTYTPAKDSDVVKLAGAQTITGNKTTTGTFAIQNGSASGAFVLGADVNATTLTANQRKLGRMGVPSYDSTTKTVAGISFDSQVNANYADFGGHPNNASSIAPDVIRFVVANEHDNSVAGKRTLALQISKQAGLSDTAGGGTSVAGAKFFLPVSSTADISAASFTENGKALSDKYQAKLTYTPATQDVATTSKAGLMSASDKIKLDGLTSSGGGNVIAVEDFSKDEIIIANNDGKSVKSSGYKIVNAPISKDITIPVGADAEVLDRESVEYGIREAMLHMMPLMIFKNGKSYGEGHEDYDKIIFKCTATGEGAISGQTGTNNYYFNLFKRGFGPILVFGNNYSSLASQIEWTQSSSGYTLKIKVDHTLQGSNTVFYGFVMLARSTALFNSVLHPDAETIK